MGVKAWAEARIGLQRLKAFITVDNPQLEYPLPENPMVAVEIVNATFAWSLAHEVKAKTDRQSLSAATSMPTRTQLEDAK